MLTDDDILKQSIKNANNNIYVSDSIKNAVLSNQNDDAFKVSITSNDSIYDFKVLSYEKNKNAVLTFHAKVNFVKDLICNDIKFLDIYLNNIKVNTFADIINRMQYKISLFKDNIYIIELEISED